MTERRNGERRNDDQTLSAKLDAHIHDFDAFQERIDVGLLGTEDLQMDGTVVRTGGLVDQVQAIDERLANGGVRVKLPVTAWVAIIVAIVAGVAQVLAALV